VGGGGGGGGSVQILWGKGEAHILRVGYNSCSPEERHSTTHKEKREKSQRKGGQRRPKERKKKRECTVLTPSEDFGENKNKKKENYKKDNSQRGKERSIV